MLVQAATPNASAPSNLSSFRVCREATALGKFFQPQRNVPMANRLCFVALPLGTRGHGSWGRIASLTSSKGRQDVPRQRAPRIRDGGRPSIDAAHIGVAANAGVVTLTGQVQSFAQKVAAERAAARVKGVRALAEEIEVRLPSRWNARDLAGAIAWSAPGATFVENEIAVD